MNLLSAEIGNVYTVCQIDLERETSRRLQALGMTEGTSITVLNNKKSGSVIFSVRGSRLAVGKKIAQGIMIKGAKACQKN